MVGTVRTRYGKVVLTDVLRAARDVIILGDIRMCALQGTGTVRKHKSFHIYEGLLFVLHSPFSITCLLSHQFQTSPIMMQSVISVLLLCFTSTSYAFVSHNPTTCRIPMVLNFRAFNQDEGARQESPVVQSKPKIVTINSAEEYKRFLAEDDRLCLIK
jgi:hypothetical protein